MANGRGSLIDPNLALRAEDQGSIIDMALTGFFRGQQIRQQNEQIRLRRAQNEAQIKATNARTKAIDLQAKEFDLRVRKFEQDQEDRVYAEGWSQKSGEIFSALSSSDPNRIRESMNVLWTDPRAMSITTLSAPINNAFNAWLNDSTKYIGADGQETTNRSEWLKSGGASVLPATTEEAARLAGAADLAQRQAASGLSDDQVRQLARAEFDSTVGQFRLQAAKLGIETELMPKFEEAQRLALDSKIAVFNANRGLPEARANVERLSLTLGTAIANKSQEVLRDKSIESLSQLTEQVHGVSIADMESEEGFDRVVVNKVTEAIPLLTAKAERLRKQKGKEDEFRQVKRTLDAAEATRKHFAEGRRGRVGGLLGIIGTSSEAKANVQELKDASELLQSSDDTERGAGMFIFSNWLSGIQGEVLSPAQQKRLDVNRKKIIRQATGLIELNTLQSAQKSIQALSGGGNVQTFRSPDRVREAQIKQETERLKIEGRRGTPTPSPTPVSAISPAVAPSIEGGTPESVTGQVQLTSDGIPVRKVREGPDSDPRNWEPVEDVGSIA